MLLGVRRDGNAFPGKEGFDPFRRPGLFDIFVDPREGLQSDGSSASSDRAPPRSCQSPPMASAAARIEPPKSKAKICASA